MWCVDVWGRGVWCVWAGTRPVYVGALRSQKAALDPLKLEFQAAVSSLTWVLGMELRSSASAASALGGGGAMSRTS